MLHISVANENEATAACEPQDLGHCNAPWPAHPSLQPAFRSAVAKQPEGETGHRQYPCQHENNCELNLHRFLQSDHAGACADRHLAWPGQLVCPPHDRAARSNLRTVGSICLPARSCDNGFKRIGIQHRHMRMKHVSANGDHQTTSVARGVIYVLAFSAVLFTFLFCVARALGAPL